MKRRLFQGLLFAALLCGAVLLAHPTAAWAEGVTYLDAKGQPQTYTDSYTTVTAQDQQWTTGWYMVSGNVTIGSEIEPVRVAVSGDVHLILTDGSSLTVSGGIEVQDDDNVLETPSPNRLTIYAQSTDDNMGALMARGDVDQTGIGGSLYGDGGCITINGGRVTAIGADYAAGIGGGAGGEFKGGTIVINGGIVKASSTYYGAGIGGGMYGTGGNITINGGRVTATAGFGAAGIGGGMDGDGGTITINGGTITSVGEEGAGIGGGLSGNGGTICITDGTVTATGNRSGAGIGGGILGDGGTITISGGTVTAESVVLEVNDQKWIGTGIGAGGHSATTAEEDMPQNGTFSTGTVGQAVIVASSIGDQSGKEAWSGVIFEGDTGQVYGTGVEPKEDFIIPEEKTLTIARGKNLTIANGITAVNRGTINNNGTITVSGTFVNQGKIEGDIPGNTITDAPLLEQSTFTYTGTNLFEKLAFESDGEASDWTLIKTDIVDAGEYTVYASNGTARIPYTVTVEPAVLTITSATLEEKTYDGNDRAVVKQVTFAGLQNNESLTLNRDYTASAIFDSADVGNKVPAEVTVTLVNDNYIFKDNEEDVNKASYQTTGTIVKADVSDWFYLTTISGTIQSGSGTVRLPNIPDDARFGAPTTTDTATVQDLSITDYELHYNGSNIRDGATYTVTIPVTGSTNFNDYTITVTLTGKGSSTGVTPPVDPPTVSEKTIDAIADAKPGETVTVDLSYGSTTLDKEVFETLAGKDVTLVVELGDGLSWTVNGTDIPEDADFVDIDLGVTMNSDGIPVDLINAITGEHGSVQMTLAHDGAFGFTMTLTAPLGAENAGYWANLYHFDEDANAMTFETAAEIGDDGSVSLSLSHASQYAIVIDDHNHGVVTLPFTDVSEGDWFYDPVCFVFENGLMTGTSATTFEPNTHLSRAMLVAVLHRLEGSPAASGGDFTDVADGDWYAQAVNWAASVDVVNGFDDGTFQPNAAITREQLAAILRNYAQYKGLDVTTSGDLNTYTDANSVSDWAKESMQWAVGEGLLSGMTVDTLEPQGHSTRAQVAAVLQRYLAN